MSNLADMLTDNRHKFVKDALEMGNSVSHMEMNEAIKLITDWTKLLYDEEEIQYFSSIMSWFGYNKVKFEELSEERISTIIQSTSIRYALDVLSGLE